MSSALSSQTFIGSKISLISRAGIRYEGILYTIDAVNSTVALSKVKSFGTEERYSERPIPPRDDIYEYIIFRGNDIQDLHVCEPPNNEMQLISQDPAIVEITGKPPIQKNSYSRGRKVQFSGRSCQDSRESDYDDSDRPSPYNRGSYSGDEYPSWHNNQNRGYNSDTGRRSYYFGGYRGRGYYNKTSSPDMQRRGNYRRNGSMMMRRENSGQQFRPGQSKSKRYTKDYDFETANAEIAKELERLSIEKPVTVGCNLDTPILDREAGTLSAGQSRGEGDGENGVKINGDTLLTSCSTSSTTTPAHTSNQGDDVPFYNRRRSFYDSISSEARDRAKGKSIRQLNWRDEQKLNVETFGFSNQRGRRNNGNNFYGNNGYYGNSNGNYWSSNRRMGPPPYYYNNYYRYGGRPPYAGGGNWR